MSHARMRARFALLGAKWVRRMLALPWHARFERKTYMIHAACLFRQATWDLWDKPQRPRQPYR